MSTPSLHDALFKQFLSDPETARDFMAIHLPESLRNLCDLTTLRLEPGTFLDKDLRSHYSDILYSVGTAAGNTGYIYAVVEHQSRPDKIMAFRMIRYAMSVMNNHLRQGHDRLPLVIPMLFYHGTTTPYPYSTNWIDMFDLPAIAWKLYSQPFPLVDVTVIPDETILQHKRIALLELIQKHIRQRDMLELADQLTFLLKLGTCTHEQLESLITYLIKVGDTAEPGRLLDTLAKSSPDYEDVIMTIAQKLEAKGRQEGRQEGMMEGKRAVARTLLMNGVAADMVMKATGLTEQELELLKH